jgi:hypothetical protein
MLPFAFRCYLESYGINNMRIGYYKDRVLNLMELSMFFLLLLVQSARGATGCRNEEINVGCMSKSMGMFHIPTPTRGNRAYKSCLVFFVRFQALI